MIEEFAVPHWVRVVARLAGRHVARSTGWRRRPRPADVLPPDPVVPSVEPSAAAPAVADPLPALAAVDVATGPVADEVRAMPVAEPIGVEALASPGGGRDDRITEDFLLAARALTARVQGLVVTPGRSPAGVAVDDVPAVVAPVAAAEQPDAAAAAEVAETSESPTTVAAVGPSPAPEVAVDSPTIESPAVELPAVEVAVPAAPPAIVPIEPASVEAVEAEPIGRRFAVESAAAGDVEQSAAAATAEVVESLATDVPVGDSPVDEPRAAESPVDVSARSQTPAEDVPVAGAMAALPSPNEPTVVGRIDAAAVDDPSAHEPAGAAELPLAAARVESREPRPPVVVSTVDADPRAVAGAGEPITGTMDSAPTAERPEPTDVAGETADGVDPAAAVVDEAAATAADPQPDPEPSTSAAAIEEPGEVAVESLVSADEAAPLAIVEAEPAADVVEPATTEPEPPSPAVPPESADVSLAEVASEAAEVPIVRPEAIAEESAVAEPAGAEGVPDESPAVEVADARATTAEVAAAEPVAAAADAPPAAVAVSTEPADVVADRAPPAPQVPNSTPAAEGPPTDVAAAAAAAAKRAASTVLGPAVRDEYNRTNLNYRRPMPRPKVRGLVIDFHCHLLARRHAADWFEAADHYGMDCFVTMSPLEEAVVLAREWGHRLRFNAVPQWGDASNNWVDNWLRRLESFYNLGSRIMKFHASPGTMLMRGHRLDSPAFEPLFAEVKARKMAIMTHIGDPDTWYAKQYVDSAKFGTRDEHYRMWEGLLEAHRGTTWVGAHLGGNPEDLPRLQRLLDKFPDLMLDCSATRWMVREVSARREPAREFFIRNQDRILFGSDQVSGDDRQFDFLASRIWAHRKLWETAYAGPSPIIDPDVPADQQPTVRGLALPDVVLQKIYHDNATRLLTKIGMGFE